MTYLCNSKDDEAHLKFQEVETTPSNRTKIKLPNFDLLFELKCDACVIGVGAILT